jgi:hypothetical protein
MYQQSNCWAVRQALKHDWEHRKAARHRGYLRVVANVADGVGSKGVVERDGCHGVGMARGVEDNPFWISTQTNAMKYGKG